MDWFTQKDVWDLIEKHEENEGFLTRAKGRKIFEYERGKNSHITGRYKMHRDARNELLEIVKKRECPHE